MTLGMRARLAWTPLLVWSVVFLGLGLWQATHWRGDDASDRMILVVGAVFLAGLGGLNLWRFARRAQARARLEGPQVDLPFTWYRRSGTWAVILFAAGVGGLFGLVALIEASAR